MSVVFNPLTHEYADGETGADLPSVTKILGGKSPFWKPEHAARGTYVHDATLLIDDGTLEWDAVDPAYIGWCRAYERFLADNPTWVATEREAKVHNERLRYAGRVDWFGTKGRRRVLIDFKTGQKNRNDLLQLCGYAMCYPDYAKIRLACLYLRNTGRYTVEFFDAEAALGFTVWEAKVLAYRWDEGDL